MRNSMVIKLYVNKIFTQSTTFPSLVKKIGDTNAESQCHDVLEAANLFCSVLFTGT